MTVHQVRLNSSGKIMTVWVDASLKLKPGQIVEGKDHRVWQVTHVYSKIKIDPARLQSDWPVGGLK